MVLAGSAALAATTPGSVENADTGTSCDTGSMPLKAGRCRISVIEGSCTSSVRPLGLASITRRVPISPSAPPRFSTTTGWPQSCDSSLATTRACASVPPPAA